MSAHGPRWLRASGAAPAQGCFLRASHPRRNPSSIRRAVDHADQSGRLSHPRYDGFLSYFRDRYLTSGQTFKTFFDAVLMSHPESQTVVRRTLAGEAHDLNNIVYALLLIAHRIRNNLFHGNKAVHTLPQQSEFFTVVNSLLTTSLEDIRICESATPNPEGWNPS